MNSRDTQRLIAMDAKIAELEYLYKQERAREIREGKNTLLLSRGIKYRIQAMLRGRNKLAQAIHNKPGRNATYAMELARRRENYENALADKERLEKDIKDTSVSLLITKDENTAFHLKELFKEMKTQTARITAFQRAYTNWSMKKASEVKPRFLRDKLPKEWDAEEDAIALDDVSTYGKMPVDEEIAEYVREYKNPLENDPRWHNNNNINTKVCIEPEPTQNNELAIPSSTAERIAIKLEVKEQLDAPAFAEQKKRIVIE